MAGPVAEPKAVASVVLWRSGLFDTFDIGQLLGVPEDAVLRTIHAARHIAKGRP